jgi:hypothetical protein
MASPRRSECRRAFLAPSVAVVLVVKERENVVAVEEASVDRAAAVGALRRRRQAARCRPCTRTTRSRSTRRGGEAVWPRPRQKARRPNGFWEPGVSRRQEPRLPPRQPKSEEAFRARRTRDYASARVLRNRIRAPDEENGSALDEEPARPARRFRSRGLRKSETPTASAPAAPAASATFAAPPSGFLGFPGRTTPWPPDGRYRGPDDSGVAGVRPPGQQSAFPRREAPFPASRRRIRHSRRGQGPARTAAFAAPQSAPRTAPHRS